MALPANALPANALPLGQLLLLDIFFPPIGAMLWWLMARGWAGFVQGGNVSDRTKARQRMEFWFALGGVYLIMFGVTLYAYLK
jgi:hypothetical protein